jgi:hypothetical protein
MALKMYEMQQWNLSMSVDLLVEDFSLLLKQTLPAPTVAQLALEMLTI